MAIEKQKQKKDVSRQMIVLMVKKLINSAYRLS